jgi:cation diffusion facilitator CzcD-associated flavoprotein CzcO
MSRHCIIGAGYGGLAMARAYRDAGLACDVLEASDRVGGVWAHRAYDSLHTVTSKASTEYPDQPMPADYPDFPSGRQMLAYLEDCAGRLGTDARIELGAEVVAVRPVDQRGMQGWTVQLASGDVRRYASVVVASGQYRTPRIPDYPGRFNGQTLHSGQYRRPDDLTGPRVLVVGAGNSACDLATDAADAFGGADVSVRNGAWFVPKSLLGRPVSELDRWWIPAPIGKTMLKTGVRVALGTPDQYGLPAPRHDILSREITINSGLLHALRHGQVRARPEIARLDGATVHFVDGTSQDYDTIVWATGYELGLPFLDGDVVAWRDGAPVLVSHVFVPGFANIAVFGFIRPRTGAGPIVGEAARVLAAIPSLQPRLAVPFADVAARFRRPHHSLMAGTASLRRDLALARMAVRVLSRRPHLARQLARAAS